MKGQSTIETIVAIGVIFVFVFLLYQYLIYPRVEQSSRTQMLYLAQTVCSDISNAIDTVTYNGNGFMEKISLPYTLDGVPYNITIYTNMTYLAWEKGNIFCPFRAKGIAHKNITNGWNQSLPFMLNISIAEHTLNNSDGVVQIV